MCFLKNGQKKKVSESLGRCSSYSSTACCSSSDIEDLEDWIASDNDFETIYSSAPQCVKNINALYCGAVCAPSQSEFLKLGAVENTTSDVSFRVCGGFCQQLYDSCSGVAILNNMTVEMIYEPNEFCAALAPFDWSISLNSTACFDYQPTNATLSCGISGPGLQGGYVDEPNSFTIQTSDSFGNKKTVGGDNISVTLERQGMGALEGAVDVEDNNDGTYTVTYFPVSSGLHTISVSLDGIEFCTSPFQIFVASSNALFFFPAICSNPSRL